MDRFPTCHAITAKWEGGKANHPDDPGGRTNYGVIQTVYDAYRKRKGLATQTVYKITQDEVLDIYRNQYWEPCGAPNLFAGVDLAIYDVSVNSGVGRGLKYRNQTASIAKPDERVKAICRARLSFLQGLKIWKTFGKGWGRRVADIEARGVMMALEAMGKPPEVRKTVAIEATKSAQVEQKRASGATKAAATTAPAGAASSTAFSDHTALWIIGGLVVVGVIVALILYARQKAAQARADAYSVIQGEQK